MTKAEKLVLAERTRIRFVSVTIFWLITVGAYSSHARLDIEYDVMILKRITAFSFVANIVKFLHKQYSRYGDLMGGGGSD